MLPRATPSTEISAGRIVGVFGLRGECKIDASRVGLDALHAGCVVTARLRDGTLRCMRIATLRLHKGRPLATFDDIADATAAESLVGASLALARDQVQLAAGEYLDADLVGCVVVDTAGDEHGAVVAVEHYPAQDMLVVGPARRLVPMVRALIVSIDIPAHRIIVDAPPGLFDEAQAAGA